MKKLYTLIIALTVCFCANAQTFHKYFSQPGALGILYRCLQTSDGGYAAVGSVLDLTFNDEDFVIVKTDASGNVSWSKKLPFTSTESFTDLVETSTGELVATGSSFNTTTLVSEAVIVKFSSTGTMLWSNSYAASAGSSTAKRIQTDTSGNVYVLGNITNGASLDYFIIKVNAAGNIVQQKYFGTPETDFPLAFSRNATNGSFIIGGWHDVGTGDNVHLLKIDSNMAVTWDYLIDGSTKYFCYDLKEKANGNILMAGRYDDGATSFDVFLAEMSSSGAQVWANSYSTTDGLECHAYGLSLNGANAGVACTINDSIKGTLVFQVNGIGNTVWSTRMGDIYNEFGTGYGINTTSDSGYVVCGPRGDTVNSVMQLLKMTGTGASVCNADPYPLLTSSITLPSSNLVITVTNGGMISQNVTFSAVAIGTATDVCPVGMDELNSNHVFSVYPNPSNGKFTLSFRENVHNASVKIFNLLGEEIFAAAETVNTTNASGSKEIELNASPGIYFVQVINGQQQFSQKIIIE